MIRIAICTAAVLAIGAAYAAIHYQQAILHIYLLSIPASADIEDRRAFWNGDFGDPTKGDEVTGGEVHGWVHPHSLVPLEEDPYPHSYDGRPPPRRWFDSKNGLR